MEILNNHEVVYCTVCAHCGTSLIIHEGEFTDERIPNYGYSTYSHSKFVCPACNKEDTFNKYSAELADEDVVSVFFLDDNQTKYTYILQHIIPPGTCIRLNNVLYDIVDSEVNPASNIVHYKLQQV